MISSKEIRHNLLEMYSKIEAIRNHDNLKTSKALESLKKELDQIRKNESDQIKKKLHNLVINLSSIREKEQCGIRKRLQGLSYNLSLIRNKEVDDCRRELQSLSVNLSLIRRKEFSFMKVFGLENNELVHSCVLAWLLDPLESHNLGSLFVERFLLKMGLKVDEFDFSKFHVEREISSDKSRLDIRIFDSNGKFQCIIENKIWSSEGNDQTKRLYSDFHGKSYERELFIFLTLNKKQPDDKHFVMMNYEQILQILAELWEVSVGDTRFLIKHYSNTLERLIMAEKFEGFSERTQLYYQHYKDTCEIKKGYSISRVQEILFHSAEVGILNKLFMFHDYPGETYEDLQRSLNFLDKNIRMGIARPFLELRTRLELQKGTPLYEEVFSDIISQKQFEKLRLPRGEFLINAEYRSFTDYQIKKEMILQVIIGLNKFMEVNNIIPTNDELVTIDLILEDIRDQGINVYKDNRL